VPTIAEAGVPGYATTTWYGLLVPVATPQGVIDRLAAAAKTAISSPEIRDRLLADGAEPVGSAPAEFRQHLHAEVAKWAKVTRSAGIKPQ
jgi:tripartite-type tricarboxylate transporter receptor subunit TctC